MIRETVSRLRAMIHNVFNRDHAEQRLSEELRGYERLLIEQHVRDGMSMVDAERAARVEMGGTEYVKENVRAARSGAWIDGLRQDVRYGLRSLRRSPAFTVTAIIALSLGIGATTSIFSVVNGVLLRPLPYRDPDALVTVLHDGTNPVSPANYKDWRAQATSFSNMAVAEVWSPNFASNSTPERVSALRLSASMWPTLGVAPVLGRVFDESTETNGADREVVLSYRVWQTRFAGDSAIVSKSILLDGNAYVVIGVMPELFAFAPFWARDAELWAPLALRDKGPERGNSSLRVFARLKPGVSQAAAQKEITSITSRLEAQFPNTNENVEVTALMQQATAGFEKPLILLLVAVSFLLVAACANVAHMMLARSASRQREMAVRIAIGASGGKLTRQLMCESVMLSSAGGVVGAAVAMGGTRALVALGGSTIPRAETVTFDVRVLAVTILVSVLTGVLFGLAPARNARRTELVSTLKDGNRNESGGVVNAGFRHALVASQFAIAMTLLVGAGLMMRTLSALNSVSPGFTADGVISAEISVSGSASAATGNREQVYLRLISALRAIPGVQAAGAINHLPLGGDVWGSSVIIADAPVADGQRRSAVYRATLPGYFSAMRIQFQSGQDFSATDRMTSTPVAIVNQQFAEQYWPGENAIGKRFAMPAEGDTTVRWRTVIGVVKNVLQSSWTERPRPEMYLPVLQESSYLEGPRPHQTYQTFVLRASGDAAALTSAVRRAVSDIDPGVSVSALRTMQSVVDDKLASQRFYLVLLLAFAVAAAVLASVGIYGVTSHAVSKRMHEMGVRIALGASSREVMSLVVGRGMRVVLVGALIGTAGAVALTRLMSSIIYGVRASDPTTFLVVAVFLIATAFIACWIPARRATRVDPLSAMRG
jgi:predicted permease